MRNPEPQALESNVQHLDKTAFNWAMALHLSFFAGVIIPLGGLIVPLIIWRVKRGVIPDLDLHAKVILNWFISLLAYSFLLVLFLSFSPSLLGREGFWLASATVMILGSILAICTILFPIIGGIKASNGLVWHYPLSFRFFSVSRSH